LASVLLGSRARASNSKPERTPDPSSAQAGDRGRIRSLAGYVDLREFARTMPRTTSTTRSLSPKSTTMTETTRHHLLFGPYRTPIFHYGDTVICEMRGEVEIVGLSSGRIPWLIGKRNKRWALVLCGALADAVRRESAVAVMYWGGVTSQTVTVWRKLWPRRCSF
jgi:hypothetical protein